MTSGWMQRMADALAAGGVTSQAEWIEKYPGVHCWFLFDTVRPWASCACCGVVKKKEPGVNAPCKGIVTVQLRGAAK
jgi:hypothetical protein